MNLVKVGRVQKVEAVSLVPASGEAVERNLSTNTVGQVEVGKLLLHGGHHVLRALEDPRDVAVYHAGDQEEEEDQKRRLDEIQQQLQQLEDEEQKSLEGESVYKGCFNGEIP